jgi:hypothetical protein
MTSTYTGYFLIAGDLQRSETALRKQPAVQRETDYYLAKIGSVKTADAFVSDRRLLTYAMNAFGLKDMAYAKAFVRKILNEGQDDPSAFVNKLADKRYVEFAQTFDFKRYGEATTAFDAVQKGVVDKYIRQTLETEAGSGNEGVRLALYFQRNASKLTSVTEILADKALNQVVKTALRLPDVFSLVNIDKQIQTLESRLDLADFKEPAKLNQFIKRFTTLWDVDTNSQAGSSVVSLFSQTSQAGISDAVMASLAKIRTRV